MQHYYALSLQPPISDCKTIPLYPAKKLCLLPPPLCTKSMENDSQRSLNSFFLKRRRVEEKDSFPFLPHHKVRSELAFLFFFFQVLVMTFKTIQRENIF